MGGTVRPVAIRLAERQERGVNGRRGTVASGRLGRHDTCSIGPCMHAWQAGGGAGGGRWRPGLAEAGSVPGSRQHLLFSSAGNPSIAFRWPGWALQDSWCT